MISCVAAPAPTLSFMTKLVANSAEGHAMDPAAKRTETRTPMRVNVDLSSLDVRTPAQEGVTENISPRGARILTRKPWKPNERLNVRSLLGNFRSRARVVYCVPLEEDQFAVGLQLFAAAGNWRSPN
jgi:PilZ domain